MNTISTDVAIPAVLNTLAIKIQKGLDLEKSIEAAQEDLFSFWQRDMDELTKDLTKLAQSNKCPASVVVESAFPTNIRFEAFIQKIAAKGKSGIKFPIKEKDANEHVEYLKQLLEKGLISKVTHDEEVKEINSRSLNEKMYKEFCELLQNK